MPAFKDHTVIILSNEPWVDLWFSKHHYANAISSKTDVYYHNPPGKWRFRNLFKFNYTIEKIKDRLFVVSYTNYLPLSTKLSLVALINSFLIHRQLKRKINYNDSLCFTFDPFRYYFFAFFKPFKLIYYVVDNYSFPKERILCQKADLIFLISDVFNEKYAIYNKPLETFSHGVPTPAFTREQILHSVTDPKKVVLAGSISYRTNLELYLKLCKSYPDIRFHFYGKMLRERLSQQQVYALEELLTQPNFVNGGIVSYPELQKEIFTAELCLNIYKFKDESSNINSLKLLQYLSLGKKVLSNDIRFYEAYNNEIIYLANNENEYLDLFKSLITKKEPKEQVEKRLSFCEQFSYETLITKMNEFIGTKPQPLRKVLFVIANNASVPYFKWFAALNEKDRYEYEINYLALCNIYPSMSAELKKHKARCYWLKFDSNKRKSQLLPVQYRLSKLLNEIQPDIIHSHLFDDSLITIPVAKLKGIKHRLVTKQDTGYHWYYAFRGVFFDRLINSLATKLIAVSGECREFILTKEKAEPSKLLSISHGIDIHQLSTIPEDKVQFYKNKFGLNGKTVVGTISRFVTWKGYHHILEMLIKYKNEFNDYVFLFVGDGPEKAMIQKKILDNGLSQQVILTGYIPQSDMPAIYKNFHAYLHLAFMEPFGFVIAEAMANKVPVISTNTGCTKDYIRHKENGYIIKERDSKAIKEALDDWKHDANKEQVIASAYATCKNNLDVRIMYENYLNLYKTLK
jgi:glycosyltransferase involved in cell wall biosynthesis